MRGVLPVLLLVGCGRFGFDADDTTTPNPDAPSDTVARITIEHLGGDGTVVGPDGVTCATGTCTFEVMPGTQVVLRGLAATGAWFAGWSGPCGGNFDCGLVVTADVTISAEFTPTPNRVFITSTTTDGAIGGIAAADAICSARAAEAGLTGTFIAYLSDSTTNAAARLATSRGWVRTDGAPFADAPSAFSTGDVWFPARLDENGTDLEDAITFSGTSLGATSTDTCLDWTSADGAESGAANAMWYARSGLSGFGQACSSVHRLLCTEIGRNVPVAIRPDTGHVAFVTRVDWAPGGGLDSADALCASEATTAGLPGTFRAALATTTNPIKGRFEAGAIYRRVDGLRVYRGEGLLKADWLEAPWELDAFGDPVADDFWTGAQRFDLEASAGENCNDWMDGGMTLDGLVHWSTNTDLRSPEKSGRCDRGFPLLCLEN